jgi:uncharacterized protein (TIGR02466 family)
MKEFQLYPTRLYSENILNPDYNSVLIETSLELISTSGKDNVASVRNGWQSDKNIYELQVFHSLCDYVLYKIKELLLQEKNSTPYITSMWLNVHGQNGFNHAHVHSGAWYSGVYYLQCTNKTGNITFLDPRPGAEMSFYHKSIESNNFSITPKTGDLILFPAWLPHFVEPNMDTENRISVAFNIELNI